MLTGQSSYILVFTAIELEALEFRKHLRDVANKSLGLEHYQQGRLESHTVIVVKTGMYNTNAAVKATAFIDHFSPSLILFVGVAGGIKDLNLGDVILGKQVSYALCGKEDKKGEFKARPEDMRPPKRLLSLTEAPEFGEWKDLIQPTARGRYSDHAGKEPRHVFGRITSTESVEGSTLGAIMKIVLKHYQDTKAIDMEGHGVMFAAYDRGDFACIVVRGISDNLTNKGEDHDEIWQPIAAAHASAVAIKVIRGFIQSGLTLSELVPPVKDEEPAPEIQPQVKPNEGTPPPKQDAPSQVNPIDEKVEAVPVEVQEKPNSVQAKPMVIHDPSVTGEKWGAAKKQLWRFYDMPGFERGKFVDIRAVITSKGFPILDYECEALGLRVGYSVACVIELIAPNPKEVQLPFMSRIYADRELAQWLYDAPRNTLFDLTVQLEYGRARVKLMPTERQRQAELINPLLRSEPEYEMRNVFALLLAKAVKVQV